MVINCHFDFLTSEGETNCLALFLLLYQNAMRHSCFANAVLLLFVVTWITGCGGSNETILPKDALTEEQKNAIKADDARIADEESQGMNKNKPKKK